MILYADHLDECMGHQATYNFIVEAQTAMLEEFHLQMSSVLASTISYGWET